MGVPTLIMSTVLRPEGSKAMALGGVETGKTKAKEVTRVGAIIRSKGFVSVPRANSAKMGMRIEAEAVFEAT